MLKNIVVKTGFEPAWVFITKNITLCLQAYSSIFLGCVYQFRHFTFCPSFRAVNQFAFWFKWRVYQNAIYILTISIAIQVLYPKQDSNLHHHYILSIAALPFCVFGWFRLMLHSRISGNRYLRSYISTNQLYLSLDSLHWFRCNPLTLMVSMAISFRAPPTTASQRLWSINVSTTLRDFVLKGFVNLDVVIRIKRHLIFRIFIALIKC